MQLPEIHVVDSEDDYSLPITIVPIDDVQKE